MPISPHAWSPAAGPRICTPSARSVCDVALVAGFSHISTFIAGATSSGQRRARHSVDSRSSARPCASLAMKSAIAGATTIRSRSRDSSMCPIASGTRGVPQVGPDRLAGQRLQGRGADEAGRGLGHGDAHVDAGLDQQARELGGLVGGDAAGDARAESAFPSTSSDIDRPLRGRDSKGKPRPWRFRTGRLAERPRERLLAQGRGRR